MNAAGMKNKRGGTAPWIIIAALTLCGCSAGSSPAAGGTDGTPLTENPTNEINSEADAQIYENFVFHRTGEGIYGAF